MRQGTTTSRQAGQTAPSPHLALELADALFGGDKEGMVLCILKHRRAWKGGVRSMRREM